MFEAEVARGVELLDQRDPVWMDKIDLSKLAMHSSRSCILGQLFGGYYKGRRALDINRAAGGYGFSLSSFWQLWIFPFFFSQLTKEWTRTISERRSLHAAFDA